ncbi:MAG: hypothetical protein AB7P40_27925 [Chloroflexota bacterium]
MKIAVVHLTRMARGFACVAGVNVENGQHVRPVLTAQRLGDQWCARQGGPFDMATVVDLGAVRPVPTLPEVEDHAFSPWRARADRAIEPVLFWEMLCHLAKPTLREVFGPDLRSRGPRSAGVDPGVGSASLGVLAPIGRPLLFVREDDDGTQKLRLQCTDGDFSLDLSVTDLRLWQDDHKTPRHELVEDVARRLRQGVPCLLSVGLTRRLSGRGDRPPIHWLQINNLHLEDNPTWRLSDEARALPRHTLVTPGARGAWSASRPPDDDADLDDLPF